MTKEDEVRAGVEEVVRREGRIDILVNNAGFGISGAIEFTPASEAKRQLDVNFFGMIRPYYVNCYGYVTSGAKTLTGQFWCDNMHDVITRTANLTRFS